jgi:1-acyl-sn-glycerol-3-phosphate acyltransferase
MATMLEDTLYRTGQGMVNVTSRLLFDLDVAWEAALPAGPKILAPNHPSTIDPFVMTGVLPERAHILIDDRLFKVPVFGRYLETIQHVPVVPGQGRAAFDAAARLLDGGHNVTIFPEGAISPLAGGFHPARTGVARLALLTGLPVIPVGIYLQRDLIHLTETVIDGKIAVGTWYWHGPYAVTVGAPLLFGGDAEDRGQVQAVSGQVMARIRALAAASEARATAPRSASGLQVALTSLRSRFARP